MLEKSVIELSWIIRQYHVCVCIYACVVGPSIYELGPARVPAVTMATVVWSYRGAVALSLGTCLCWWTQVVAQQVPPTLITRPRHCSYQANWVLPSPHNHPVVKASPVFVMPALTSSNSCLDAHRGHASSHRWTWPRSAPHVFRTNLACNWILALPNMVPVLRDVFPVMTVFLNSKSRFIYYEICPCTLVHGSCSDNMLVL
uniref:Uncharacterized protein n=1 Tax=Timema cristinae TaxID=61476 RepID=A0A7R9CCR8_TIMCR|nr:unnamed protein product [Timema cristinae]